MKQHQEQSACWAGTRLGGGLLATQLAAQSSPWPAAPHSALTCPWPNPKGFQKLSSRGPRTLQPPRGRLRGTLGQGQLKNYVLCSSCPKVVRSPWGAAAEGRVQTLGRLGIGLRPPEGVPRLSPWGRVLGEHFRSHA